MKGKIVSDGAARSVKSPTEGFCDASTSTTVEYVDLSTYGGSYVEITCETANHYVAFGAATGFTMDVDAATVGTTGVPTTVLATENGGQGKHFVVDPANPWLGYRTTAATGLIRVVVA